MIKMSDEIKVIVIVSFRLQIQPEQYINLWISLISFWFFLQNYSFVIAFCIKEESTTLKLLIESQKELIFKFLRNSINVSDSASADLRLTLFSESHEFSASLAKFETVLLMTSRLEIVTQLSYLRHLIRDYNDFQVHTRRIHLIWQLESLNEQISIFLRDR